MALVVQKYGGTSVGTTDRIKNVAKRVIKTYDAGNDLVVVVSARPREAPGTAAQSTCLRGHPSHPC